MKYELLHISSGSAESRNTQCFMREYRDVRSHAMNCNKYGGVAEWLKAPVSKTGIGET